MLMEIKINIIGQSGSYESTNAKGIIIAGIQNISTNVFSHNYI